jgi:hypothetical protein
MSGIRSRHFDLMTLDGRRVRYEELWQRRNLVLVLTDPEQRGEIMHIEITTSDDAASKFPSVDELLAWVRFAIAMGPRTPRLPSWECMIPRKSDTCRPHLVSSAAFGETQIAQPHR